MTDTPQRSLGWLPDPKDERDHIYSVARPDGAPRPRESHLYELVEHWGDQDGVNACVGFAVARALELRRRIDGAPNVRMSEQHIYWTARAYAGLQDRDDGSHITYAIRGARKLGYASYADCPFEPDKVLTRPDMVADVGAWNQTVLAYQRITGTLEQRIDAVLDALANDRPVICGKQVTPGYLRHRDPNAVLRRPTEDEERLGGHATVYAGHRTEAGGSISLAEVGSWIGSNPWGGLSGKCLGWVDAGWLAECHDLTALLKVQVPG